jgi:hypothetical protein
LSAAPAHAGRMKAHLYLIAFVLRVAAPGHIIIQWEIAAV